MALSKENWAVIRKHFDRGKTPSEISRIVPFKISRQAIEQRIKKEGWKREAWKRGGLDRRDTQENPRNASLDIPRDIDPIKAAVLCQIASHGTPSLAYSSLGVPESTYRSWKKSDPEFAQLVEAAQAQAVEPIVQTAYDAAKTDPKWSWEWLQKHPSVREEFGSREQHINVGRIQIGNLIPRSSEHKALIDASED